MAPLSTTLLCVMLLWCVVIGGADECILPDTVQILMEIPFESVEPLDTLTAEEIDALGAGFMAVYNAMQAGSCDNTTKHITHVEGAGIFSGRGRGLYGFGNFEFNFELECNGCSADTALFDDAARRLDDTTGTGVNEHDFLGRWEDWIMEEQNVLVRLEEAGLDVTHI